MTSTLDPSHKQIEMWRRATGSEGGLDEYRNWVLENSMRFTAYGIHTVIVEGEAKHITALDDVTLCNEWAKLKRGLRANGTKTYAKEITNCYN